MPNYCNYQMKIVGETNNADKLLDWLRNDYAYFSDVNDKIVDHEKLMKEYSLCFESEDGNTRLYTNDTKHFYRVFDTLLDYRQDYSNGISELFVSGDCAWSVYCCMFDGESTYYRTASSDKTAELRAKHAITLSKACEELDLSVEVYSYEPGNAFAEHYIINRGEITTDDTCEYSEICISDYDTKEEAENAYGADISVDDWLSEEYLIRCKYDFNNLKWAI